MALILAEGFDAYGVKDGATSNYAWPIDSRWSRFHYAYERIIVGTGRRGTAAMWLQWTNSLGLQFYYAYLNLSASFSTLICGFAYKAGESGAVPAAGYPILLFQKGGAPSTDTQFVIHRTSSDGLEVRATAGGSLLGSTAAGVVTPGSYQYWEIKAVCHASAGSVIIKVDGVEVLNLSGINTQNAGSGAFSYLHFRAYNHNGADPNATYIDDLIVMDDTGSTFNDFQGDVQVQGHLPTSDGTYSEWTSTEANHYEAVNDVGETFDDDYIESSTEGQRDSFTIVPAGDAPGILAVEVAGHGLNTGAGTAKVTPSVIIGGITYDGSELTMPPGTSGKVSYVWERNPATNGIWSRAVLAAAQFGFEVTEIS
jgi:hypothetical protein